ncbi:MAG: G5 domain-containing protein [Clostridiales bacterium]|nr:G5 domain-containing protein [Candidatus Cacconaster stercorequi]
MKHSTYRALPRLYLVLLAALLVLSLSVTMAPAATAPDHIYALKNGNAVQFVGRTGNLIYEDSGFYIHSAANKEPQVVLRKEQEVTLHTHNGTLTAVSRLETVTNLLRRLHIAVDADDMIIFDMTAKNIDITLDHEIALKRDLAVDTTYDRRRVANPLLYQGEERVKQKGKAGTIIETYEDIYRMGSLAESQLIKRTNDNAVTEIVEYGTRVDEVNSDAYITDVHTNSDGSGYLTFNNGETMTFSCVTDCTATAYSGGWGTASGMSLGNGTVAVDTSVFPFGTRFYIQASDGSWVYGMGTAKDTGSAIKDHKIDLWFSSYTTSCQWGVRDCTVYVLD